jgi:hypothetical protein
MLRSIRLMRVPVLARGYASGPQMQTQPREQSTGGQFDVMSFINRVEALFDAQNKKQPSRAKDLSVRNTSKGDEVHRQARIKDFKRRDGSNQQQRPNGHQQQSRRNQWSNKVNKFVDRSNTEQSHHRNRQDNSAQDVPAPRAAFRQTAPRNVGAEKLDIHVAPASSRMGKGQFQPRSDRLKKTWSSVTVNQRSTKTPRKSFGGKGNSKGMFSKKRTFAKKDRSSQQTDAKIKQVSGITAEAGLDIIHNLINHARQSSQFVAVRNIASQEFVTKNLAPSAITYDTRIWSAINSLRITAQQRLLLRSNRSLAAKIVEQTVNGSISESLVKPANNKLGFLALANSVNANGTLTPSAKRLISEVASGKLPIASLKKAN